MPRCLWSFVLLFSLAVFVPGLSFAQSLAGAVRDTSGGVLPGVTVKAASPHQDVGHQLYGDRVNVVDMRVAKVLRFGNRRATLGLDLYNMFNVNTPSAFDQVYDPNTNGARWLQPTAVLLPRFMRVNAQFDF